MGRIPDPATETGRTAPLADSVLQLLWREGSLSRADIARELGLSRSTVTETIRLLLPTGFVHEGGRGASSGGRRPTNLEFQYGARELLGIELGSSHITLVRTDLKCVVLQERTLRHDVRGDPEGTLNALDALAREMLAHGAQRLAAVGVAVPSPVDPRKPGLLSGTVAPAWAGRNDLDRLRSLFNVPLYVDNDANLGALAEHWWGVGCGVSDFIYVKAAYGLGAGYILDGSLYRGSMGLAGEIGHLSINPDGAPCSCGQRGCLVRYVGGRAIRDRAVSLFGTYPDSVLAGTEPSLSDIEDAARDGDALACHAIGEAGRYLGSALGGLLNVLNPRLIVIGGRLAQLGATFMAPLKSELAGRVFEPATADIEIRVSTLGARSEAVGAATLALQRTLATTRFYEQTERA